MYQNVVENMKTQMQPVLELAESNKATMEKLANLQKETMTEVVSASMQQVKALSECKDPKSAMELQNAFYKDLLAKMTNTSEQSIAAMNSAKETFSAAVEAAAKKTTADVEAAVNKATGK